MKKFIQQSSLAFLIVLTICLNSSALFSQWTVIPTGSTHPIRKIQFADANNVFALGDSLFIKSTDGGHIWTDLTASIAAVTYPTLDDLYFINKDTGFVYRSTITAEPYLLKTVNGGLSFTSITAGSISQGVNDMIFVSNTVGFLVGGAGGGIIFVKQ